MATHEVRRNGVDLWVVGHASSILHSADGGQNWDQLLSGTDDALYSITIKSGGKRRCGLRERTAFCSAHLTLERRKEVGSAGHRYANTLGAVYLSADNAHLYLVGLRGCTEIRELNLRRAAGQPVERGRRPTCPCRPDLYLLERMLLGMFSLLLAHQEARTASR
jgi:hypothetical protein